MLILKDINTHNLKHVSLQLPLAAISVVTGVSGSGKSSLVFDTIHAEAYRRYLDSLSSFARQYIKALPKPKFAEISQLPPSIALKQTRSINQPRSTVGTLTELSEVLRIIFAGYAQANCYQCDKPLQAHDGRALARLLLGAHRGQQLMILAPLKLWSQVAPIELQSMIQSQGFSRIYHHGNIAPLADFSTTASSPSTTSTNEIAIVIDRLTVTTENSARLEEALTLAFKVGRGLASVVHDGSQQVYSRQLYCWECNIQYPQPGPSLFSADHVLGACPQCKGFGDEAQLDWSKVIPDAGLSLDDHDVKPWNFGSHVEWYELAADSAKKLKFKTSTRFQDYGDRQWQWLKQGDDQFFGGISGYFSWLDSKRYKPHYRIHAARFRTYHTCSLCAGQQLNVISRSFRLDGMNFAEFLQEPIHALAARFSLANQKMTGGMPLNAVDAGPIESEDLAQSAKDSLNDELHRDERYRDQLHRESLYKESLAELRSKLSYLVDIGVGYLSLARKSITLSGGEFQRISLARSLGSGLTDTLYCLDEPSAGLHPADSNKLIATIAELKSLNNTVILVEHDPQIIKAADYLVRLGPGAGRLGGQLITAGPVTKDSLQSEKAQPLSTQTMSVFKKFISLEQVSTHNLKNIRVNIPIGGFTGVCGVSGSGKSSLIIQTLYPLLEDYFSAGIGESKLTAKAKESAKDRAIEFSARLHADSLESLKSLKSVLMIDQKSIGRSSRSNIATYVGLMEEIRRLFAAVPTAKKLGLSASHFSFNSKGGRCEPCQGLGYVVEDMSFLGEVESVCPHCNGQRFIAEVLEVRFQNLNLLDVLHLTMSEAATVFTGSRKITELCALIERIGLGYVQLGQNTSSFSGGELQRLKLLNLLKDADSSDAKVLILDEPTVGLSEEDVARIIELLRLFQAQGHTIIVIEHNLQVLRQCDWLIEIGPGAAAAGGELIYEGPLLGLRSQKSSITAPFLF